MTERKYTDGPLKSQSEKLPIQLISTEVFF